MQVIIRLLRSRGVPISPAVVAVTPWTEGRLETGRGEDGGKCLLIRELLVPPDRGVLCELYQATVTRAQDDYMILRGIERVTDTTGKTAAVVQEWQVKLRPQMDGAGRLPAGVPAPALKLIRHE
jgi:hypothetical protein